MSNIENGVFQAMRMQERAYRKAMARRPICAWCEEPIWHDRAYRIDGNWVCPDCLKEAEEYFYDEDDEDY